MTKILDSLSENTRNQVIQEVKDLLGDKVENPKVIDPAIIAFAKRQNETAQINKKA